MRSNRHVEILANDVDILVGRMRDDIDLWIADEKICYEAAHCVSLRPWHGASALTTPAWSVAQGVGLRTEERAARQASSRSTQFGAGRPRTGDRQGRGDRGEDAGRRRYVAETADQPWRAAGPSPRINETVAPADTKCPCCKKAMHVIGEETSERLDVIPAQYRVIVTHRPRLSSMRPSRGGKIGLKAGCATATRSRIPKVRLARSFYLQF